MTPTYPPARLEEVVDVRHGERISDPYRWLEDANSAETKQWVADQQQLFAEHQQRWPDRGYFADRVAELMRTGTVGPPA